MHGHTHSRTHDHHEYPFQSRLINWKTHTYTNGWILKTEICTQIKTVHNNKNNSCEHLRAKVDNRNIRMPKIHTTHRYWTCAHTSWMFRTELRVWETEKGRERVKRKRRKIGFLYFYSFIYREELINIHRFMIRRWIYITTLSCFCNSRWH